MSRVYKARDQHPAGEQIADPFVAVKVLSRPFKHEGSFAALRGAVQTLTVLNHPNVVRLFSCERDGTTVFLTMEYLRGRSLYSEMTAVGSGGSHPLLERGKALSILDGIAAALTYATGTR